MIALYIVLGVIAIWLALTLFIVSKLFFGSLGRRKEKKTGVDTSGLVVSLEPFKEEIKAGKEWYYQQDRREVDIVSYDGTRLHADILEKENAIGTIILMHGYRSIGINDFTLVIPYYRDLGYNIIMPDQRACGKSDGKYVTLGIKERYDCKAWADFAAKEFGEDLPIILDGISMGATTVMMAAGLDLPKNIAGVIADCGFTSPYEVVLSVLKATHIPAIPNVWFAELFARVFAKFSFKEASTIDSMQKCEYPIYFIHGKKDDFVPYEMSERNFAACISKKKGFFSVDEAGHGMCYLSKREELRAELKGFLAEAQEIYHANMKGNQK